MRPQVTDAERALARLLASDTARYERRGIVAAARIGFRAQRRAIAAYRAGGRDAWRIPQIVHRELMSGLPELRDSMTLAYLVGIKRSRAAASLSLSASGKATKRIQKTLGLTQDQVEQIREKCNATAFRVLANASAAVERKVQEAVNETIAEGVHVREAKAQLLKAFEAAGITPRNSFQLEAIFRTQMQMAYGAATWQSGQDRAVQEILWGYKYVTVGDDRVRPEHEGLDGTTLPKGHVFWTTSFPPNGWVCRCAVIELFEERDIREAPASFTTTDEYGREIEVIPGPDNGFGFNPGQALGLFIP